MRFPGAFIKETAELSKPEPSGANAALAEDVFRAHQPALLTFLRKRLNGDRQAAADVAQEAFIRILAAPRRYDPVQARGLLYRIARNLLIDRARSERARVRAEASASYDAGTAVAAPDHLCAAKQEVERIERAILDLPPRCREIYVLHRFEGLSYKAIASRCGISSSVVEKQMQKALKRLVCALDTSAVERG